MSDRVGIKRIIIQAEPYERMSDVMLAVKLRELADQIEAGNKIYARNVNMTWTFDEAGHDLYDQK